MSDNNKKSYFVEITVTVICLLSMALTMWARADIQEARQRIEISNASVHASIQTLSATLGGRLTLSGEGK